MLIHKAIPGYCELRGQSVERVVTMARIARFAMKHHRGLASAMKPMKQSGSVAAEEAVPQPRCPAQQ